MVGRQCLGKSVQVKVFLVMADDVEVGVQGIFVFFKGNGGRVDVIYLSDFYVRIGKGIGEQIVEGIFFIII